MSHKCFNNITSCVGHDKKPSILDQAKAYTDSQRIAYAEGQVDITFDGNIEGKEIIPGSSLVKVSNNSCDLTKVKTVTQRLSNGTYATLAADAFTFEGAEGVAYLLYGNDACVVSSQKGSIFDEDGGVVGTFVLAVGDTWISKVEFTETIHPIDPKFIPGAPFKIRFSEWGFSENNSTFIKNGYFEIPQELRDKFVQTCVSSDPIILINDAYPTEPISLPAIQIMPYEYADDGAVASWGAIFEERGIAGVLIVLRVSTTNNTDGKASCIVESVSTQTASVSTEGAE